MPTEDMRHVNEFYFKELERRKDTYFKLYHVLVRVTTPDRNSGWALIASTLQYDFPNQRRVLIHLMQGQQGEVLVISSMPRLGLDPDYYASLHPDGNFSYSGENGKTLSKQIFLAVEELHTHISDR